MSRRRKIVATVLIPVIAIAVYCGYLFSIQRLGEQGSSLDREASLFGHGFLGVLEHWQGLERSDPLRPTGDKLTDEFAQAVMTHIKATQNPGSMNTGFAALLPEGELAQLGKQFGKDPNYWELRYLRDSKGKGVDALVKAQQLGVATSNSIMLEYFAQLSRRIDRQQKADKAPDREKWDKAYTPDPADAQLELGLLDAAVARGRSEAWPHYLRAIHWFALGQDTRGFSDLQAGNTASALNYPMPYPVAAAYQAADKGGTLGCKRFTGAVGELELLDWPGHRSGRIRFIPEQWLATHPKASPGQLQTWMTYALRLPLSTPKDDLYLPAISFRVILDVQQARIADAALSGTQRETLDRMLGAIEKNRRAYGKLPTTDTVTDAVPQIARYGPQGYYVAFYDDLKSRSEKAKKLPSFINDIAQVDMVSLAMPDSLRKYPRVTMEQIKARRAKARAKQQAEQKKLDESVQQVQQLDHVTHL